MTASPARILPLWPITGLVREVIPLKTLNPKLPPPSQRPKP